MKLWQKNTITDSSVETFTVGNDREFDVMLAPFDIAGNIAHAHMLASIGMLTPAEEVSIVDELKKIYASLADKPFKIEEGIEDVHSQVEFMLTQSLGDTGKKIH